MKKNRYLSVIAYLILIAIWAGLDAHRNNQGLEKLIGQGLGNDIAAFIIKYAIGFLLILYVWYRSKVKESWKVLGVFLIFAFVAWAGTDLTYNIVRDGVGLDHVGTTSWSDRIFQFTKYPFIAQTVSKLILLVGGILIYKLPKKNNDDTQGEEHDYLHVDHDKFKII